MSEHHHDDGHDHSHGHGHHNDQGIKGILRYLRFAPEMWRSSMNEAVVETIAPRKGEVVLDIGAGMGAGTVLAAKAGATVIAIEPTPFMRTVLRVRRLFQRGRKRITVIDAGAERLPSEDASVDAVFAVNTMHHWVDPAAGAAEVARVLRPAGRLVLVDEDFDNPDHPDFERFGSKHGQEDAEGDHHGFTMIDAAQMGDYLTAAGLENAVADERTIAGAPVIAVTRGVEPPR